MLETQLVLWNIYKKDIGMLGVDVRAGVWQVVCQVIMKRWRGEQMGVVDV